MDLLRAAHREATGVGASGGITSVQPDKAIRVQPVRIGTRPTTPKNVDANAKDLLSDQQRLRQNPCRCHAGDVAHSRDIARGGG
jgi:hypothetical protein